jgi:hypothetical protein
MERFEQLFHGSILSLLLAFGLITAVHVYSTSGQASLCSERRRLATELACLCLLCVLRDEPEFRSNFECAGGHGQILLVRFCSNLLKNLATSIDSLLVTVLKYEDENNRLIMLAFEGS